MEQCGGNSGTVMVEQCCGTVEECLLEKWNSDGGIVLVDE